jgi:hypothetical protein
MKEQSTGIAGTNGQPEAGIVGYSMTPLEVALGPSDIAAIRKLRIKAQVELRELIDKDTVKDHG